MDCVKYCKWPKYNFLVDLIGTERRGKFAVHTKVAWKCKTSFIIFKNCLWRGLTNAVARTRRRITSAPTTALAVNSSSPLFNASGLLYTRLIWGNKFIESFKILKGEVRVGKKKFYALNSFSVYQKIILFISIEQHVSVSDVPFPTFVIPTSLSWKIFVKLKNLH